MRSWLYRKSHVRRVSFPRLSWPYLAYLASLPVAQQFLGAMPRLVATCHFNPSALFISLSSTTHGETLSARSHHPCSSQHTELIPPSACPSSCTFLSQHAMLPSPPRVRPRSAGRKKFSARLRATMARPGDARAMQGAVMPPPCNGCRRVLRCAALCCTACCGVRPVTSAAMPACVLAGFCVLRRTCG
jgi:hypothetical protein